MNLGGLLCGRYAGTRERDELVTSFAIAAVDALAGVLLGAAVIGDPTAVSARIAGVEHEQESGYFGSEHRE